MLEAEDLIDEQNGLPPRFGKSFDVNYNLSNSGFWTELPNEDRIWRLKISCSNSLSINLLYDSFWLPDTAKFHIYSTDETQVLGGFNNANNSGTYENPGKFTTGFIFGDEITLELYEPKIVRGFSKISIDKVIHGYKELKLFLPYVGETAQDYGDSGPCQVNINCSEGQNWQNEKKGVVLILSDGDRICTGSLVNNTSTDGTPYVLTADHCFDISGLDAISDPDGSYLSFFWNYESLTCNDSSDFAPLSTSGATMVANNPYSDFALLELTESPLDSNIDVYFNGWDRNTNLSPGGVSIHHPWGDFKKISTHNMVPIDGVYYNPPNTHWLVYFIETTNGFSVTEEGSSGSPLFNNNKRIIGQLEGGGSANPNCSDPANDEAEYGRFDVSWNNSTDSRRRLKDWLDPSNTNQISLDGLEFIPNDNLVGDGTVCATPTTVFTIINENPPYNWTVSSNITITQNNGNSITVIATNNQTRAFGNIQVSYSGGTIDRDVWVGNPLAPASLYGPEVVNTGAIVQYYGDNTTGATSYQWWLPFPFDVVTPIDYFNDNWQTWPNNTRFNSHVFTGYGGNSGYVQLMGVNKCGVGGVALLSVVHNGGGGGGIPVAPPPIPNSANENFTLDFSNHPEGIYYIYIYDIFSNIIYYGESGNVEKTVDTLSIPGGNYFLHIYDGIEIVSSQLIIIH